MPGYFELSIMDPVLFWGADVLRKCPTSRQHWRCKTLRPPSPASGAFWEIAIVPRQPIGGKQRRNGLIHAPRAPTGWGDVDACPRGGHYPKGA